MMQEVRHLPKGSNPSPAVASLETVTERYRGLSGWVNRQAMKLDISASLAPWGRKNGFRELADSFAISVVDAIYVVSRKGYSKNEDTPRHVELIRCLADVQGAKADQFARSHGHGAGASLARTLHERADHYSQIATALESLH